MQATCHQATVSQTIQNVGWTNIKYKLLTITTDCKSSQLSLLVMSPKPHTVFIINGYISFIMNPFITY